MWRPSESGAGCAGVCGRTAASRFLFVCRVEQGLARRIRSAFGNLERAEEERLSPEPTPVCCGLACDLARRVQALRRTRPDCPRIPSQGSIKEELQVDWKSLLQQKSSVDSGRSGEVHCLVRKLPSTRRASTSKPGPQSLISRRLHVRVMPLRLADWVRPATSALGSIRRAARRDNLERQGATACPLLVPDAEP